MFFVQYFVWILYFVAITFVPLIILTDLCARKEQIFSSIFLNSDLQYPRKLRCDGFVDKF